MAYSTHTAPSETGIAILSNLARLGRAIGAGAKSMMHAMIMNSTAQRRLNMVERLQAKSDAELAELGLRRQYIVHHVFRDLFWT